MLRRKLCVWPAVAAAFWTGCAFGPHASRRMIAPVDYKRLGHFPAAPMPITAVEMEAVWGVLGSENSELADQVAGIEGVFQGWVWCAVCGDNKRAPHNHTGTIRDGGGGRGVGNEIAMKRAIFLMAVVGVVLVAGMAAMYSGSVF